VLLLDLAFKQYTDALYWRFLQWPQVVKLLGELRQRSEHMLQDVLLYLDLLRVQSSRRNLRIIPIFSLSQHSNVCLQSSDLSATIFHEHRY